MKRSLYQCSHAIVKTDRIVCDMGRRLQENKDGTVGIVRLQRGDPLEMKPCQSCLAYDEIGGPVEENDRGWIKCQTKRL